jgi:hypothetical protein
MKPGNAVTMTEAATREIPLTMPAGPALRSETIPDLI